MTEQPQGPQDPSDHQPSVDAQLIAALDQADSFVDRFIRDEIGDEDVDGYYARRALHRDFENATAGDFSPLKPPAEIIAERAAEIAQELIELKGELPPEIEKAVRDMAIEEYIETFPKPDDDEFLHTYGEITDRMCGVMELELEPAYPRLTVENITDGILTFQRDPREKGGPRLRVSFQVVGDEVMTSVLYESPAQSPLERWQYTQVDPTDFGNEIEGINIDNLKKDALAALTFALQQDYSQEV